MGYRLLPNSFNRPAARSPLPSVVISSGSNRQGAGMSASISSVVSARRSGCTDCTCLTGAQPPTRGLVSRTCSPVRVSTRNTPSGRASMRRPSRCFRGSQTGRPNQSCPALSITSRRHASCRSASGACAYHQGHDVSSSQWSRMKMS